MSNTVIRTNVNALTSHRNLTSVSRAQSNASARLSSGKKINTAADDAAGMAISSKMQAQIKGLDMASKNAEDAISLVQTADGSFSEIDNMVQRIRELTVQAANDSNTNTTDTDAKGLEASATDRYKTGLEIGQLLNEIDQIAGRTEFNTKLLATGNYADSALKFQIGANTSQQISLNIHAMDTETMGIADIFGHSKSIDETTGLPSNDSDKDDVETVAGTVAEMDANGLTALLDTIDAAVSHVAIERSNLGAIQNRLTYTNNNLKISSENLSSAKSAIEDADMGKEMMNLTSANVLQQAATSMLAQANQGPQNILQLIQ